MSRAADLALRLGQEAETVCRFYLPNGHRQGRYWQCGDVHGTAGQSLYVSLSGARAGKWTDAATGEHGDLLDLIALNRRLDIGAALDEARQFLSLPRERELRHDTLASLPRRSTHAASRLFVASKPVCGTLADTYLRNRGLILPPDVSSLRFHPNCYYRTASGRETWPTLIAAVTDMNGSITGVHRTWLDPTGGKAPVGQPRRAMGYLLGNGVRFGIATDVLTAAEGIETALSIATVMPHMPIIAALSAAHLAALVLPPSLRRLYVARDNDEAGRRALERLRERIEGIVAIHALVPKAEDFNADLVTLGPDRLRDWIGKQLMPDDSRRFLFHHAWQLGDESLPQSEPLQTS